MSRRPRPGTVRRVRRCTHTANTTSAGAQAQARRVMAGSPGLTASMAAPDVAMRVAGTYAHRCGRVVMRVVSQASIAQPVANATRAAPTMRASDASCRTANVRAAAPTAAVAVQAAMMRPTGPVAVAGAPAGTDVGVRVAVVMMVSPFLAVLGRSATEQPSR